MHYTAVPHDGGAAARNQDWVARDLQVLWHPCTQMKDHESFPLIPIRRGEGVYLEDMEGKRYLDAISSWWVNVMGHCHPAINAAIKDQVDTLEHVIMAGFTHEPAIALAEALVEITAPQLTRVFYADNGSAAIEVALKMSYHAWRNQGQHQKRVFMTLDNSYHGETLGALSVSQVGLYKNTYADLLTPVVALPVADTYRQPEGLSYEAYADGILQQIEILMQKHADNTCALIVEPLVQCAGGMRMYKPYFLNGLFKLTRRYGIHLIVDEIATGFGRTGTWFASEQADIEADFLCVSKGLTGGYLPMSVVMTTEDIYQQFYADYREGKAFLHSHSYTGNPLACRAALATIALLRTGQVLEQNKPKSVLFDTLTGPLQDHPHVGQVRHLGMITAIELVQDKATKTPYPWQERRGRRVFEYALSKGVLLRPIGDVVYFMPPYVITDSEIHTLVNIAKEGIDLATRVSD